MTGAVSIEKHEGPLPWRIMRDGKMLIRYPTRKLAALHVCLLEGDAAAAPEWYRAELAKARRSMSELDALRYAMGSAQLLGIGPEMVRADPNTGAPL